MRRRRLHRPVSFPRQEGSWDRSRHAETHARRHGVRPGLSGGNIHARRARDARADLVRRRTGAVLRLPLHRHPRRRGGAGCDRIGARLRPDGRPCGRGRGHLFRRRTLFRPRPAAGFRQRPAGSGHRPDPDRPRGLCRRSPRQCADADGARGRPDDPALARSPRRTGPCRGRAGAGRRLWPGPLVGWGPRCPPAVRGRCRRGRGGPVRGPDRLSARRDAGPTGLAPAPPDGPAIGTDPENSRPARAIRTWSFPASKRGPTARRRRRPRAAAGDRGRSAAAGSGRSARARWPAAGRSSPAPRPPRRRPCAGSSASGK
ncbi:hypothetical protein MMB232_02344 [Brevundimonas subvibrioides]